MKGSRIVHVIDDDPAVRDSIRLLLATENFVARTHCSVRDFLSAVERGETGCVVTDVRMPEMSGFDLLAEMKGRRLDLPVIIITAHADVPLAVQAMKAGAIDLLEKPFAAESLLAAVRRAMTRTRHEGAADAEGDAVAERLATLTPREREVLAGLLKGQSNKVIGLELGISVRTVEVHRANVMAKMRAGSLSELVRMSLLAPFDENR